MKKTLSVIFLLTALNGCTFPIGESNCINFEDQYKTQKPKTSQMIPNNQSNEKKPTKKLSESLAKQKGE